MLDKYEHTEIEDADKKLYKPIVNDVAKLQAFSKRDKNVDLAGRMVFNENNIEVFNFGKHKGKPVTQVLKEEPQYYDWMMKGDFALHTKQKLTEILNRTILNK